MCTITSQNTRRFFVFSMCTITSQNTKRFFVFSMHFCTITNQNTIQFFCFFSSFSAFLFLLYNYQIKINICKITIQSFAFCTFLHSSSFLYSSGLRLWPRTPLEMGLLQLLC
ncbi:hypothetical protein RchiOBHm_Chr1g0364781 [Rosa chinensis]|uniref:Uncharacterized protein n=1 Tax=Rosa chinensis TaxID=74649 RepID=A0A2P6SJU3_ROSCH|nr:hypothetical protein RchiOBHm_Chr1g0364781 [Rosa chinensis]